MMSAVMMVFAAACSVEETPTGSALAQKQITIQAVAEEMPTDDATRSVRLENGDIWWTPGDQISVFYGSGADGGSCFTAQIDENKKVANFTGTIGVITGGGDISVDQTYFWGLYPYNDTALCDGTTIVTDVPDCQTAVAGTFAPGVYPWIGRSQGLLMSFYGLCGGIKFTVNKEGIKKATLKSLDGSPLAGRVRIALDANGIPSVQEVIDGKDEVVLEAPDGEYFIPGKYYFFVTLPHNFNTSFFTVKFETFTEEGTYERKRALEIKRADFIAFGSALDGSVTYEKKTGAIPVEDAAFKDYLVNNFDTDGDGEISYEEAASITKVWLNTDHVESMQGIEYMEALDTLYCNGKASGRLKNLDVSNNKLLTFLSCGNNQLIDLIVSGGIALEHLSCENNLLTCLDVSNLSFLRSLLCSSNQLSELNLSNNTQLTGLNCSNNLLSNLDLSNNELLTGLHCSNNCLSELDLSNNKNLKSLSCSENKISNLLIYSTSLETILCDNNELTVLNLPKSPKLFYLYCYNNKLTSISISSAERLAFLLCYNNQITEIDIEAPALLDLSIANNLLTNLDVSKYTVLRGLYIQNNTITEIDLSNSFKLSNLNCSGNQLRELDLSNNKALSHLDCSYNYLSVLNVSNNIKLGQNSNTPEIGLWCCQHSDADGTNLLKTLYIADGQVIPYINDGNRSDERIPASTAILIAPTTGGGEGSSETPEEP